MLHGDACLLDTVRHNVAQRCTFALQCPTHFKGLVKGITITHEPEDMYQSSKKVWLVVGTTSFSIVVILYMVCMHACMLLGLWLGPWNMSLKGTFWPKKCPFWS